MSLQPVPRPGPRRLLAGILVALVVIAAVGGVLTFAHTVAAGGDDNGDDGNGENGGNGDDGDETPVGPDTLVRGEPDLSAFAPNRTVNPGQRQTFVVEIANDGTVDESVNGTAALERAVTTARGVSVRLKDGDAPITVEGGTVPLGDVASGTVRRAGFQIAVDEDAEPGTYDLPVKVSYDYVEEITEDDRDTDDVTETFDVELVVRETARFEVVDVDSDVQVGDRGTVSVTLENVGEEDVREASVQLGSPNGELRFDGSSTATRFVGDWDDGDEETVEFDVGASNTTAVQRYPLQATVSYVDSEGRRRTSRPLTFGIRPVGEQTFDLDDVEGTLRIGEDGTVTGSIQSEGPGDVSDAVLVAASPDPDVALRRTEYVVGGLDDGESEDFSFPARVAADAEPGTRQFSFVVRYRNEDDRLRRSDRLTAAVDVTEERNSFAVREVASDLQVGREGTISVTVENVRGEPITDSRVSLRSAARNLSLSGGPNATQFVGAWDEGETRTLAFEAAVADGSDVQRFPLVARVSYTRADGDDAVSDPLRFGVVPAAEQAFRLGPVVSTLEVGSDGTIDGRLTNRGPADLTDAVVRIDAPSPGLTPQEPEFVLGRVGVNGTREFSFPVAVGDDAEPGSKQISFVVEYDGPTDQRRTSRRLRATVTVADEADDFAVGVNSSSLQVGSAGTLSLRLRNVGNESVTAATVSVRSASPELAIGPGGNATRFVGNWTAGATRTVRFRGRLTNDTVGERFPVVAAVTYTSPDGDRIRTDPLRFGVEPAAEQAFALANVTSTLRVAEEGVVRARVVNDGPQPITDGVVTVRFGGTSLTARVPERSVGDLAPGAAATVPFNVEVPRRLAAGTYRATFEVQYETPDDERRRRDRVAGDVAVSAFRPAFALDPVNASFEVDSSGTLVLSLGNNRGERVTDLEAVVRPAEPLSSEDPSAFTPVLDPGKSTTAAFHLEVSDEAIPKLHPLLVNVTYTDAEGRTRRAGPYRIGVSVVPRPGTGLPILAALAVVAVLAVAGLWWWRRR